MGLAQRGAVLINSLASLWLAQTVKASNLRQQFVSQVGGSLVLLAAGII